MYDIAIIGGGPAGATAAIFAAKAGKKTLLIDNDKGMTRRALLLNYYAIDKLTGPDMVDTGLKQAEKLGTEIVQDTATALNQTGETLQIETENSQYEATHVILATGAAVNFAEAIGVQTTEGTEPRIKKVVKVDSNGKTNLKSVWAAGTCAGVSVHAIITAGDGAKVAVNVISELNGKRYVDHDVLKA